MKQLLITIIFLFSSSAYGGAAIYDQVHQTSQARCAERIEYYENYIAEMDRRIDEGIGNVAVHQARKIYFESQLDDWDSYCNDYGEYIE